MILTWVKCIAALRALPWTLLISRVHSRASASMSSTTMISCLKITPTSTRRRVVKTEEATLSPGPGVLSSAGTGELTGAGSGMAAKIRDDGAVSVVKVWAKWTRWGTPWPDERKVPEQTTATRLNNGSDNSGSWLSEFKTLEILLFCNGYRRSLIGSS